MSLFPTDQHYGEVQVRHPLPQLDLVEKSALGQFITGTLQPFAELTIQEWWIHLSNRMIHARQVYHLMLYYFELGIPDDRPFISPGREGESVEYFPDFTDDDFSKKAWFDFYSDVFGYKLFSAWDSIGQFFAEVHEIKVKRPTFHSVALELKNQGITVGEEFLRLWDCDDFTRFREIQTGRIS
jgi:Cthe_2314-like HEPN